MGMIERATSEEYDQFFNIDEFIKERTEANES
jgi:hypothetical protein